MKIHAFDRSVGRRAHGFGSDLVIAPLMGPLDTARAVCLHLAPGEFVAEHPAASRQLFCVVAGSGWVSGPDGERVPIGAGRAAAWEAGERHAAGTDDGLTAVVLEGDGFEVAAPPVA